MHTIWILKKNHARDETFPFAYVHLSQSVCIFLSPLLDITLFSNDLFDESR
jgi:hypothetical protein